MTLLPLTDATTSNLASPARATSDDAALWDVARELEASFLAEMLKHAGFGGTRQSFGGGVGEDQFGSLLRAEHARALTARGGIGLAESLFAALVARNADPQGTAE